MWKSSLVVLLLAPVAVLAQEPSLELTPTVGYHWGGSIRVEDRAFTFTGTDVELGDSGSFSLTLGIPVARRARLELVATRQDTALEEQAGVFGEVPGWVLPVGDASALDVDLSTLQVGGSWQLGERPDGWFLAAAAGLTHVDFALALEDDTRLSVSVGGGYTMGLSRRLALRYAARLLWVDTDEGTARTFPFEHPDCGASCAYVFHYQDDIFQTQLQLGLVIRL